MVRVVAFPVTLIEQLTFDISEVLRCLILILFVDASLRRSIQSASHELRWDVWLFLTREQVSILSFNRLFIYDSLGSKLGNI